MKIALAVDSPKLDANIESRLGQARYLLIVDTETMDFKAVKNNTSVAVRGAGIRALTIALENGAKVIIAGSIAPHISRTLRQNNIEIVTSVNGTAFDIIEQSKYNKLSQDNEKINLRIIKNKISILLEDSLKTSLKQFFTILPVVMGVILLAGMFETFVSSDVLSLIFPGKTIQDTIIGASFGSISAGNPINSYVIGDVLSKMGVSLFGIAAFLATWTTVGLLQLPVEIASLGFKFAFLRIIALFILSIPVAILTVLLTEGLL